MITLYYVPSNASFAPHVLLRELGVPFELRRVDREHDEHKSPAYLKLNPNGQIPVLVDGDLVLYETAAILMHLADTHPQAGLLPAVGSAARAEAYKWLVWMTNTLQPALMAWFYPERWVSEGDAAAAAQVKAQAQVRAVAGLVQLEALLAGHGGPWLLGERFSALDPMAFMLCRWTRGFPSQRARDFPQLGAYLQRLRERPAMVRTIEVEQLPEPVV